MAGSGQGNVFRRNRWPALDGIRGVAVLLVVFYHFHLPGSELRHLQGGWAGVDMFFVLSGFLITTMLIRERFATGTIAWTGFYRRRWNRLGPALLAWVVIFETVTFFVTWPQMPDYSLHYRLVDLRTISSLGPNWWVIARSPSHPFMSTIWSLGIEEQFYLLWPLTIILVCRRWRAERAQMILLCIAIAGAFLSAGEVLAFHHLGLGRTRIYFGTDTRAQELFVGSIGAMLCLKRSRVSCRTSAALAVLGVIVVAELAVTVPDSSAFEVGGAFTVLSLSAVFVIVHLVRYPSGVMARLFSARALRWVGQRSYALYLWQGGIATYLYGGLRSNTTRYGWVGYFGGISLCLLTADLSWRVVESRWARRTKAVRSTPGNDREFVPPEEPTPRGSLPAIA